MKKAVLASAVVAAMASGSTLAAEVYSKDGTTLKVGGRAEFRGDFQGKSSGKELDGTMENKSRFRLNVGGETQISDNLTGFGFYEAEQTIQNSDKDNGGNSSANTSFKQRYMYAGIGTQFGAFSFGKQDTANVQVSKMTDIGTHTNTNKDFISAGDEQVNNTIKYTGDFMDALVVEADFVASDEKSNNAYGLSGIYQLPIGLGIGLGYSAGDLGETLGQDNGSSSQFIGGLSYEIGSFYIAGSYTQGDINDKATGTDAKEFTGTELAGHYKFGNGFRVIAAYAKSEEKADNGDKTNTNDFIELTGRYDFNKSIRAYATYKINNLKADSSTLAEDADNSLRLGLRYNF
ncbi:porin [Vibrio variabilis]|uniref:porin n=1 Tax=Vibrio variabilis TaxID=990271 RepID=UPI000DD709CD|nr:porin [Vibrio variabilis]